MDEQCKYTLCIFRDLSQQIGCHEGALKLILSLIAAYPIGIVYNLLFVRSRIEYKHLYFLLCGLGLGFFNYGVNIVHTLTAILTVFFTIRLLHGNRTSVIITFSFCTAYLIWGYCKTQSEEYAFEWTIPQCVVTLRLIAIAFDVYDGSQIRRQDKKKSSSHSNGSDGQTREQSNGDSIPKSAAPSTCNPENPSKAFPESKEHVVCNGNNSAILNDSTETTCSSSSPRISKSDGVTVLSSSSSIHWNEDALLEEPSLLQMLAHCYFPASFLVGPQFGLKQYLEFVRVNNSFLDKSLRAGADRLALGIIYLAIFQAGSLLLPHQYLVSSHFKDLNFYKKLFFLTVITKIQLCKYLCIWLISEGSCVMSGVTFDLKTDSFDKSSNVRVFEYETTSTFGGIIHSFNVTTNRWAAKYVFKRLRFLRSKFLSHILTLVYLALWHGYKSGYYVTFTIEFLIMKVEKDVMEFIEVKRKTNKGFDAFLSHPLVYWFLRVFFRVYTLVVFGYCLVPFLLLNYIKWWDVLQELYFFGHVIYIPAVILAPILLQFLKPRRERASPTVGSQSESGDKKIN